MSTFVRRRLLVAGRVQGVGYRAACARVAAGLPISGSVRNLTDGRVEVIAAGTPEVVEQLTEWCRTGPRWAEVETVAVTDEPADVGAAGAPIGPGGGFHVL